MQIGVVTLFPEMLTAITDHGISGRAFKQNLAMLRCWSPRDFTEDKHRTVDDRPYGGGPGMVMKIEPLRRAITAAKETLGAEAKVIYLSPQGRQLDQRGVQELCCCEKIILVAGRYEGIDERLVESHIDEEWSIGDYVLSGGELAAMVMVDTIVRQLPGVLGHEASAQEDSFADGLLDCPHFTRPEDYDGRSVPEVLMSGDHNKIRRWRLREALGRTWLRRRDLLDARDLTVEEEELLASFIAEFNVNSAKP
jgi:tRNA (guanine37-N1)-methyltransferase